MVVVLKYLAETKPFDCILLQVAFIGSCANVKLNIPKSKLYPFWIRDETLKIS